MKKIILTILILLSFYLIQVSFGQSMDFTVINKPYKGNRINSYNDLAGKKLTVNGVIKSEEETKELIEWNTVFHFYAMAVYFEEKEDKMVTGYLIKSTQLKNSILEIEAEAIKEKDSVIFEIKLDELGQPILISMMGRMWGKDYKIPKFCLCK